MSVTIDPKTNTSHPSGLNTYSQIPWMAATSASFLCCFISDVHMSDSLQHSRRPPDVRRIPFFSRAPIFLPADRNLRLVVEHGAASIGIRVCNGWYSPRLGHSVASLSRPASSFVAA